MKRTLSILALLLALALAACGTNAHAPRHLSTSLAPAMSPPPLLPVKPHKAGKPTVEVDPFISQLLHASTGTWTGNPTAFAYQWQRCDSTGASCSSIAGATSNTYTVLSADAGSTIRVQVTASNSAGSASQTSAATTVVLGAPFNTSLPVVTGTTTQGQVLTSTNGVWNNTPTSFGYQWERCDTTGAACSNIAAATNATYTLVSADAGHTLRAQVSATNASGSAFATSQQTGTITTNAGTTFYVDGAAGSNTNNGTSPATAWQTIAKVNATTLTADQSVLFKGGQTFAGELDPLGSGTSGHPTTYGSYGTGKAILSGAPGIRPTGVSWVTFSSLILDAAGAGDCVVDFSGAAATNIVFDNDEMRNCVVGIDQSRAADANWTIQNSFIHDTSSSGIVLTGPSHTANGGGFIVQDNQIEHVGTPVADVCNCNNAHGIYDDSPGLIVRRNDIGNFQTDGVSVRFRNATIENNTIHDGTRTVCCAEGVGYYNYDPTETAGQGTSIVRYNRIWNVPYGIHMSNEADGAGSVAGPENWRVYNNLISGSGGGSGTSQNAIEYIHGVGTELIEKNNVIAGSFSSGAQANVGTPTTYQEDYNDWSSVGGAGDGNTGAHDKATGANLSAAPNFAPPSGSVVIDAGTSTVAGATFTNDCLPLPVLLSYCGSAPDMGAIEFQTGVSSGPANTSVPLISGSAIQGQSINSTTGTWSGSPTSFAYQWQACDAGLSCTNVTGQTGSSYNPLLASEINHTVRVAVTATNAAGSTTALSAVSAIVAPSGTVGGTPTTPVIGNAGTVCNKYAAPGGNDSTGTGLIGAPYLTPTKLVSVLTAGQVGCLRAGTYGTTSSTWTFTNATGVTLTAFPGEAAIVNGWPAVKGAGLDVSYLNFDTNNIQSAFRDGSQGCGTSAAAYFDIEASNVTLEHSNLYESDVATASRDTEIGVAFPGSANYTGAVTGVRIQNNQIHDYGSCKDFDHGIYTDNGSSESITGNWIYNGPFGGGVQIWDQPTSNITISSNVMDGVGVGVFIGASGSATSNDTISNNVISNTTGCSGFCTSAGFSSFGAITSSTFSNNDLFNVPAGACSNCSGVTVSGSITSDPQYTNSASADYRTQASAVAGYGLWNGDAGSAVSDPALLGKASVGGSAATPGMGSDLSRAIKYTSAQTGTIKRLVIYLSGGLTAGTQTLQASVYADSSGTPGALLATSTPISFSSTGTAGWYDLTLTTPLAETSGTTYWLDILSGATSGVAGFRWDSVTGSRLFQTNPFANGPVNPFGTPSSTDDEQMSFYAIVG